jgi:two-component system phosphate regulon response regulator PhoB
MAQVMFIEDNEALGLVLRYKLEAEDHGADTTFCGDESEAGQKREKPDVLVLDWTLPQISGIELFRENGSKTKRFPVVMVAAVGEEAERIRSLVTGTHDYTVKPFFMREFLIQIKAVLHQMNPELIATPLRAGDIELDRRTRRVYRAGRELHLSPVGFRLLEFLMANPGPVFSREQIRNGIWGPSVSINDRTVDVHMGRLRKVLKVGRRPDPIRTVRGSGYAFKERQDFSAHGIQGPRSKLTARGLCRPERSDS